MGCGASTPKEERSTDSPPEKAPQVKQQPSGDSPVLKQEASDSRNTERRKTTTDRRAAVSTEILSAENEPEPEVVPKDAAHLEALIKSLHEHPLFAFLAEPLRIKVAERMHVVEGVLGTDIITQGDPGDNFYVVFDGKYAAYANGQPKAMVEYKAGDGFGELALLYNSPRAATVRCTEAGTLFALGRIAFRKLVMAHNSGVKVGLEKFLSRVPDLKDLEDAQIAQLANVMDAHDYKDGEYIVQVGDQAESLYLILSGEVVCHSSGGEEELKRLREGEFFGEMALKEDVQDRKRQANVVAVGQVRIGELKREDFKTILGSLSEVFLGNFKRKVLDSVELLKPLQPGDRELLLEILEEVVLDEGATVIEQGTTGTHFYIIKTGSVAVHIDGNEVKQLFRGDHFGERALLTEENTAASIKVRERTELMKLGKAQFEKMLGPLEEILQKERLTRERELERQKVPKMRWEDLKEIATLGEGSFGRVKLMLHKPDKQAYALKCLQKGQLVRYQQVEHVVNEKRVLQQCDHPFILRLVSTFNGRNEIYMMLELALGGELFSHLRLVGKFAEPTGALYGAMVTSAFAYLHARKIAHRDLKPENLLFDKDGFLKLVDFGFAKYIKDRTWTLCGTPEYLAPEIISNKGHNHGADWWTLGVLIYEMLVGQPPFMAESQIDTYHKIMRGKYKVPANFTKASKDIISKLLCHNPAARLGTWRGGSKDVINHEFFSSINWATLEAKKVQVPYVPKISNSLDTSNFDAYPSSNDNNQWDRYNDASFENIWQSEFGA